jgi:hypothetical protein
MARRIARWSFVIATLFLVPAAFAQTGSPTSGPVRPGEPPPPQQAPIQPAPPPQGAAIANFRAACDQDFARFCLGVQPGGGRIVRCLLGHRGELSPSCRSELAAARPASGAAPIPNAQGPAPPPGNRAATLAGFQASCGSDAQRLCAGAPRENNSVAKCLFSHGTELSPTCKVFLQKVRAQRADQKNTPSNIPPPPTGRPDVPPGPPPGNDGAPAAGPPDNQ